MPLQGDQRALLQLICERGQSYEDIAGLLGGSIDDVRAKARSALTELGGADPDAEVGLTDYLLGQADPIGRADAVRFLQSDPGSHELATRIEAELRELAPQASLPKLPEPRGKARRAATPASGEPTSAPPRTGDSEGAAGVPMRDSSRSDSGRQSRLIAAIVGAGIVLVFVVLAVTGVFSSDDEGSAATPTTASTDDGSSSTTAATDQQRTVTEVPLKAVSGSGIAGNAAFGIVGGSELYVDLVVDGLDPEAPRDSAYFIWLMLGETGGYPLNERLEPDANGRWSGRIAVPAAVAATVAGQSDSVKISLSPVDELAKEARQAVEDEVPIVPFTGEELASGKIPLVAPEQG